MSQGNILQGRCVCDGVAYQVQGPPLFVHCCHCTWCQRETGSAFVLNALIESSRLEVTRGEPTRIVIPSHGGKGQDILRCPRCQVALWSHYSGVGDALSFLRVGTLDEPWRCPPDINIYVESKLPYVVLNDEIPAMSAYYRRSEQWSTESLARWAQLTRRPGHG